MHTHRLLHSSRITTRWVFAVSLTVFFCFVFLKTCSLFIFHREITNIFNIKKKKTEEEKNVYFGCAKQPGAIIAQVSSEVCSAVSSTMLTITSVLWPGSLGSTERIFSARLSP